MNTQLKIILLVAGFFFLNSCKEEEAKDLYHYKINSCLYPMLFNNGSYWIYMDSVSGISDSIFVTGFSRNIYPTSPTWTGQETTSDEEQFSISYKSFNSGETDNEVLYGMVISKEHRGGNVIYIGSRTPGDSVYNAVITGIADSIIVEGHAYYNVTIVHSLQDEYLDEDCNFYYADSIGVIRKEILVNNVVVQVRSMIRCHVNLYDYR